MESTQRLQLIRQFVASAFRQDSAGLKQCLDPEVLIQAFSQGKLSCVHHGCEHFSAWSARRLPFFECRKAHITHLDQYENGAVVDVDFTGNVSTSLPDGLQILHPFRFSNRYIFRFRDGRISELTECN